MTDIKPLISIVVPAYNEAGNVAALATKIGDLFQKLNQFCYEIIFVNDGSLDATLLEIKQLANENNNVFYLSFSRNFGQTNALRAGVEHAKGACILSIDCDLQHPVELIEKMLEHWQNGYEVVHTLRQEDKNLPFLKRFSSKLFHKIISKISDVEVLYGESDFRLFDRKVADVILALKERDLFWRGIVKWVGFKQISIEYTPNQRFSGQTSYSFGSLLRLAIRNIFSFGVRPLYFITSLGGVFIGISLLYLPYIIYSFINNIAVSGWTSTIMIVLFFAGLNLLIMGVLSVYFAEMFMQIKERPHYIVSETNVRT